MKNMLAARILSLIFMVFFAVHPIFADEWETITSGWEPNEIMVSGNKVIASSIGGIIIYDSVTEELNVINKDNGLSSNNPVAIDLDEENYCLWIGHENASIDLFDLRSMRVKQTISSLETDTDISTINDIDFYEGKVYIATDKGFSFLTKDATFGDYFLQDSFQNFGEWRSPAEAFKVSAFDNKLFFALSQGIAVIDTREDHRDYNNSEYWTNFSFTSDLGYASGNLEVTTLDHENGVLYLSVLWRSPVLKWENETFVEAFNASSCRGFTTGADGLIYTGRNGLYRQTESLTGFENVDTSYTPVHNDVVALNGKIYAAVEFTDKNFGGIAVYDGDVITTLHPNSPGGDEIQELFTGSDGTIWASARNSSENGVYHLVNGSWIPYSEANVPGADMSRNVAINTMAVDAYGDLWVGSWGNGIHYFPSESDTVLHFGVENSILDDVSRENENGTYVVVSGFVPDEAGGLWLTNQEAYNGRSLVYIPPFWFDAPLADKDNFSWLTFGASQGMSSKFPGILLRDKYGRIWMGSISAAPDFPIIVLDLNGYTPEEIYQNPGLADYVYMNSVRTGFTTVNDMNMEENGTIWLATSSGLFHVDTNISDFDDVEFEQINLIEAESASSVMIDPLNQIWVGTNNGVFVLGKDRHSWVRNYQIDIGDMKYPSPLVSNAILTMTFDPVSGKAYLGTDNGISVVKTPFRDFSEEIGKISLSPQPFLLDESGTDYLHFSSESLVAGAEVKIYTPSGKLVRELNFDTAGSVGWDGRDDDGGTVGTGVYLIVVTTPGGTSEVGKAAVVRK